jgi:SAM-dependent methyltransferase
MPIFDHFGLLAPYYDRVIGPRAAEKLVSLVDLPINGSLLDAGGGTGRVSHVLRGMAKQIIIADVSQGMLRQVLQKEHLAPVCSMAERLPLASGSIARIMMVDALHHVHSQRETVAELWRVLEKGGRLLIEEPDYRTFPVKLVALAEKIALMRSHLLRPEEIVALIPSGDSEVHIEIDGFVAWIVAIKRS